MEHVHEAMREDGIHTKGVFSVGDQRTRHVQRYTLTQHGEKQILVKEKPSTTMGVSHPSTRRLTSLEKRANSIWQEVESLCEMEDTS